MLGWVLVVDAANVVGSRPDGWWRDRPAAARRLVSGLRRWCESDGRPHVRPDAVVVVVEGAARRGFEPTTPAGYGVVHVVQAPAAGDDEIGGQAATLAVEHPGVELWVVTADRALRARLASTGARLVGPAWLWRELDATRSTSQDR